MAANVPNQLKHNQHASGYILAAPHSGSGKTTLSIGLMRALRRRGVDVVPAKIGPDYIDPQFHQVAAGRRSVNLDGWAMSEPTLASLGTGMAEHGSLLAIEGVMGLFDGAVKPGVLEHGATADIAKFFKLPVVLVVDCAGMGQSVAALVKGFAEFDPKVNIAGVILNKLGSMRHVSMMQAALDDIGMAVIGAIPRHDHLVLPSRHLGLVQASESIEIEDQIERIADQVEAHVSLERLEELAMPPVINECGDVCTNGGVRPSSIVSSVLPSIAPLGQHIAVAADDAFRFFYPHLEEGWRRAGAEISFFSPLDDEAPARAADAIYLPGGYPELHAGRLAANQRFIGGLQAAAQNGIQIYGECGGYMVLGDGLVDKEGSRHKMAGLLSLETSFEKRKLHLGYRHVVRDDGVVFRGHEFHYATTLTEKGGALFSDVGGEQSFGLRQGSVSGSFVHLIDRA